MKFLVSIAGEDVAIDLQARGAPGAYTAILRDRTHDVDLAQAARGWLYSLLLDGHSYQVADGAGHIELDGHDFAVAVERDVGLGQRVGAATIGGPAKLAAPIPGLVVAIHVKPGEEVQQGQTLVIVEAMKMQMELKSPRSGHVSDVGVEPGQEVAQGQMLAVIGE